MKLFVVPAYTKIATHKEVFSSKDKFLALNDTYKDACVIEEALVIAIERGYVPFKNIRNFQNVDFHDLYMTALQKICTTLTSGWFREYASKNYLRLSNPYCYQLYYAFSMNIFDHFESSIINGLVKPYKK